MAADSSPSPPTRPPLPLWHVEPGLTPYADALAAMENQVAAMADGTAAERIWLVEHPPVITAGTSARNADLLDPARFPVVAAGRGGQFTYHGPGQRVVYPMIDLGRRGRDVRIYVAALEQWVVDALAHLGVAARTDAAGVGVWTATPAGLAKVAAIGVRIRRWISFHGVAINVTTDLGHYGAIVPCGIATLGVTRLADVAPGVTMADLDSALERGVPSFMARLEQGGDAHNMFIGH